MDNSGLSSQFLGYLKKSSLKMDSDDAKKAADAQRKRTALMYSMSLKSLDNRSICHVLENNLNTYSEMMTTPIDNKIKKVLSEKHFQTATNLKSELTKRNAKSLLKPLNCCDGLICETSEVISDNDFENFLDVFCFDNGQSSKDQMDECEPFSNIQHNDYEKDCSSFKTATEEFRKQQLLKNCDNRTSSNHIPPPKSAPNYQPLGGGTTRKCLGGVRRTVKSKFVPPFQSNKTDSHSSVAKSEESSEEPMDERLRVIDPKMVELIKSEIMDCSAPVDWSDIAGLDFAKTCIQEVVVWPMLRPDIFTGLRRPPKGILLFGPPGTGKTLIGKCVASQSKSTFFCISASSLTSKWVGDGEKMVRALFTVARCNQPAVIFIDEIDSLLTQRSDTEHESSRRIKTEFLVQLDGASTDMNDRILVIGATNRPQELDEAARRRFVKRLYIPLPDFKARLQLVTRLISGEKHELSALDFEQIANMSEGYSGADIRNLCAEASLGPIRSMDISVNIEKIKAHEVRPLLMEDFLKAFGRVRSSVSSEDLHQYEMWDNTFGSGL